MLTTLKWCFSKYCCDSLPCPWIVNMHWNCHIEVECRTPHSEVLQSVALGVHATKCFTERGRKANSNTFQTESKIKGDTREAPAPVSTVHSVGEDRRENTQLSDGDAQPPCDTKRRERGGAMLNMFKRKMWIHKSNIRDLERVQLSLCVCTKTMMWQTASLKCSSTSGRDTETQTAASLPHPPTTPASK